MSRQSEKGIIGCLLLDENCIVEISNLLTKGMFEDDLYRDIYDLCLQNYKKGERANEVTIKWVLGDKYPEEVLNQELLDCIDSVTTTVEVKTYADTIASDYRAREADKIIQHTEIRGVSSKEDIQKLIRNLQPLVSGSTSNTKSVSELVKYKDRYFCDRVSEGVKLGIHSLDDMLGCLEGGDTIIIGARPSVGKSALVTQIAINMAKQGKKIGYYNMEMQEKQMYERFISHISGIGVTRLRNAIAYTDNEQELFDKANETLEKEYRDLDLTTGSVTVDTIRNGCYQRGYDVVIIDYLQLITPATTYKGNRASEVSEISRAIKNLAMEMNIPVIALSQLNRVSEVNETKEPTMSELRESGAIEQDASVIILMWNKNEEHTEKGIKVEKNRQGKVGKIELKFNGNNMKFVDTDEWEQADDTDYPFN